MNVLDESKPSTRTPKIRYTLPAIRAYGEARIMWTGSVVTVSWGVVLVS